jgi:hypothetical protein
MVDKNQYVTGKELHLELFVCIHKGQYSNDLYRMVDMIIKRFSRKFTYRREEHREDCKAYAHMRVYMNYRSYKIDSNTAFAFITQIVKNAFYAQFNELNYIKNQQNGAKSSLNLTSINDIYSI